MKIVYYFLGSLALFAVRQLMVPIWGGWADIFFIVPPVFMWLWLEDESALVMMIITSVLLDILLSRALPYYTLATMISWVLYYLAIQPYLSHNTELTRLLVFVIWLFVWRATYIVWLLWGWFIGGPLLDLNQPILWPLLGWFILGLSFLAMLLVIKWLWQRYIKKFSH